MSNYSAESIFLERILEQMALPITRAKRDIPLLLQADLGLRSSWNAPMKERIWEKYLRLHIKQNTLYQVTDEYTCSYIVFLPPEEQDDVVIMIGPYLKQDCDAAWVQRFCQDNQLPDNWKTELEDYYRKIRVLKDISFFNVTMEVLCDYMWGENNYDTEEMTNGLMDSLAPISEISRHSRESFIQDIRSIEARYEAESRLMQAVAQGLSHRAKTMLAGMAKSDLVRRSDDQVRDFKNYSVILNTLLRKAAEQGGVHPLYIDRLSNEYACRIEKLSHYDEIISMWQEMAHKYCVMVKKHSSQKYSQLVQQVISRVDYDISADLSLKANAEALNVNASYLSALFKKEKGMTLTEYVNRKRVEHAIYLLSNSTLSVSSVGQYCGIQDDNYFTKMFKKYTGKTPKQFRHENARFPK